MVSKLQIQKMKNPLFTQEQVKKILEEIAIKENCLQALQGVFAALL